MKNVCCALLLVVAASGCAHTRQVAEEQGGPEDAAGTGKPREKGASPQSTPSRVPPRGDRPAVSSSPQELMNPGSARRIQEALRGHGYLAEVSGRLDRATSIALQRFQHDQDLAETGAPDRETLRRLNVDPSTVYQTARGGHQEGTGAGPR
jgi:hypothetical protein